MSRMHPTLRPSRLAAGALAVALGALLLTSCGGEQQPDNGGAEYVALGDSATSGAGIAPVRNAACARSEVNYPSLVADEMGYTSFEDVSCGGADTTNLTRPQAATSNGPQLDAVGTRTRLVTLTLGLNDKKLSTGLYFACLSPSGAPTAWCQQVLAVSEADTDKLIAQSADRLEDSLRLIEKRAPKARIILVGYPRYLPDSGSCPDRVPLVDEMVPRLRDAMKTANEDWKKVADEAGADYVDTYALSDGHDICSSDPWINGAANVAGKASPMHPFEAFHQAVAEEIVGLLKSG